MFEPVGAVPSRNPPQPAPQWFAPVAGCGFVFRTERCVFSATCCGSARPWLGPLQPRQPWRHGGVQGCPSAVLGAGPGEATQGESRRDQGYLAQGSRKPPREGSLRLWLWGLSGSDRRFRSQSSLAAGLWPVPEAVARFVGCLGGLFWGVWVCVCGGRGSDEEGEESICLVGLCSVSQFLKRISLSVTLFIMNT